MVRKRKQHKIINDIEHKHCPKCDTWKLFDAFFKYKLNWDGLKTQCKDCEKEYQKEYQKEYRKSEKYKKYHREYSREYYNSREDAKEKKYIRKKTNHLLNKLLPRWKRKYIICEVCRKKPYDEFHHFVYGVDNPLCGLFICSECHSTLHR